MTTLSLRQNPYEPWVSVKNHFFTSLFLMSSVFLKASFPVIQGATQGLTTHWTICLEIPYLLSYTHTRLSEIIFIPSQKNSKFSHRRVVVEANWWFASPLKISLETRSLVYFETKWSRNCFSQLLDLTNDSEIYLLSILSSLSVQIEVIGRKI